MSTEIELKFELAPAAARKLEASQWFRELEGSARRERLVSVYFDTRKRKLRDEGISLRVRHVGRKRLQTIKTAAGAPLARTEWEKEIEGDVPDLTCARETALEALATKKLERNLAPVFETRVVRTSLPLQMNGSEIELALDRGLVQAGERRERISEIELELKGGNPRGLGEMARRLAEEVPIRYGLKSKAERGYALAESKDGEAVRGEPIELEHDATVADAFKVIGFSCLRHFALNEEGVRKGDAEAVHQMRVGLRRLRAAISIFKDILQDSETETLKTQLKWLTEQLAPARDYDVFVKESILPQRGAGPHEKEMAELESVLGERRAEGFENARSAVASDRYRQIVVATALWHTYGDWATTPDAKRRARRERRIKSFAREVFQDRAKRITKKLEKVEDFDARQRHKLRIAIKKLHYGTEFFATLFAKSKAERKTFTKVLKKLQDVLGQLNDIMVHERLAANIIDARRTRRGHDPGRKAAYAMGLVTGREDSDIKPLLSAASRAGAHLARLPRFWR